jgi:hypothetical protein
MSITIKHLDGPLQGKTQEFGDAVDAIVVGRATTAEIAYPEECTTVSAEHLILNRDEAGSYAIELCGSGDVEIDGEMAEDGATVDSGSVITLGEGGPSFEVLLPGLTIKHLDGPLAGKRQYFSDNVAKIIFGRSREEAQVVYPPDYAVVGVKHFALNRSPAGDYQIELFGKRYVAMDGRPVINGATVKPGAVFRLGKQDGPAFKAEVAVPVGEYVKTEQGEEMPDVGGWLYWLRERTQQLGMRSKQLAAGGGLLALLLAGVVGWMVYENQRYNWVEQHMLQSVYLVVEKHPMGDTAAATAFLVGDGMFATNAHVTEAMRGKVQAYYLLGPKGDRIEIENVESHPGYLAFKAKALTYAKSGSTTVGNFQSMPLPSAYDVGIIKVDPAAPKSEPIEIETAAPKLEVGDEIITAGFPSEKIRGADNMTNGLAAATFRRGTIESLKDIFFSKTAEDPEHLLLVQNGIPATGGMSGSPLVDAWTGKVVAVFSGGNTRSLPGPAGKAEEGRTLQDAPQDRITDPAQVNYAQRADLLADLIAGNAQASLVEDQAYWDAVGAKFKRYSDLALGEFSTRDETGRGNGEEIAHAQGLLVPGKKDSAPLPPAAGPQARAEAFPADESLFKAETSRKSTSHTYSFDAEPGFEYGFIVDTIDALPPQLDKKFAPPVSIKLKQAGPFATQVKAASSKSELPLALVVAVTAKTKLEVVVGGLLRAPVRYTLYAYRWPLPEALVYEGDAQAKPAVQQDAESAPQQ